MGWEVNQQAESLKQQALDYLSRAIDVCSYSHVLTSRIESGTGVSVGRGHHTGDKLLADSSNTLACLLRAQTAIQRATSLASEVDTTIWVPDQDE
ncbi:MAG: hypothetical protein FWD29_05695 [Micrococcales bacterium]|nr:hypothetical protein [Micrococcales bacterium]